MGPYPPKDNYGEHVRPVRPMIPGGVLRDVLAGDTGLFGGAGAELYSIDFIPLDAEPGSVWLTNGTNSEVEIFKGGADSTSNRIGWGRYFYGVKSEGAGWQIRCGANIAIQAILVL